jgi:hypothetical protein
MTYEEWLAQVPDSLKNDPIWKFEAYPNALLLYDLAWEDANKLLKDVRGLKLAGQLVDSVGSISANIDEGFGRGVESGEPSSFCAMPWVLLARLEAGTISRATCSPLKLSGIALLCATRSLLFSSSLSSNVALGEAHSSPSHPF